MLFLIIDLLPPRTTGNTSTEIIGLDTEEGPKQFRNWCVSISGYVGYTPLSMLHPDVQH